LVPGSRSTSFAELKKQMMLDFYNCFSSTSTEPGAALELRMSKFYEAEMKALNPKLVRDSFAIVDLQSWDPILNLENCRKQTPVTPQSDETGMIDDLAQAMTTYETEKQKEIELARSSVRRASDPTTKIPKRRERSAEGCSKAQTVQCNGASDSSDGSSVSVSPEVPVKRAKIMHVDRKTYASRGCQNTHLWSKKWVSCPKCHKNFCEIHKDEIHHHQC